MKKIFLYIAITLGLLSCNHKDSLWQEIVEDLDERVETLEMLCAEMNTNIASLQTIVDVLQSNDFITSIVEIKKDGKVVGYTITFGKHDPITIYHGQDGKDGQNGQNGADGKDGSTPVIGVAQDTDGVYYWTLNGEWLLDDNGNKLPVSGKDGQNGTNGSNGQDGAAGKDGADGQDGKDGITPQLKIEDGYWYISYDNGATWTQLGKATGEDGKDGADGEDGKDGQNGADGKDGPDGDSMFQSVTQDGNYVYFTLADGTVIKIAKGNGSNDQPNEDDIIDFKDLAVKSALLKLGVDTTKDNEISYGEAAAYKKELNFVHNNGIYSFKECQYFTNVKSFAFGYCSNLFEIDLPNNITSIDPGAFHECSSLISLTIPNSVTKIGNNAFMRCSTLVSMTLPESVISIESNAFYGCVSMKNINIPCNITSIGSNAFIGCSNLNVLYDAKNCSYDGSSMLFPQALSITLGNNVEYIPAYMFYNDNRRESIDIPKNVKSIGTSAFQFSKLASVTFSEGLETIGSYAFSGTNLTSVQIPRSIKTIGSYAFTRDNATTTGPSQIYCEAITPPTISGAPFNVNATIYVPRAYVEDYKVVWSAYASRIVGYDFE